MSPPICAKDNNPGERAIQVKKAVSQSLLLLSKLFISRLCCGFSMPNAVGAADQLLWLIPLRRYREPDFLSAIALEKSHVQSPVDTVIITKPCLPATEAHKNET